MDHVVYLDTKAGELDKIRSGVKTMIIRGATGRKMPYGRVLAGDVLYLIENDGSGKVRASCSVRTVFNSEKLTPEASEIMVDQNEVKLQLTPAQRKRWAGKRYLVLIEIQEFCELEPFSIDKRDFGNMDDWLPVGEIDNVR
jgi:hypothetical protein